MGYIVKFSLKQENKIHWVIIAQLGGHLNTPASIVVFYKLNPKWFLKGLREGMKLTELYLFNSKTML